MAVDTVRRLSESSGREQLLSNRITQFDWLEDPIQTEATDLLRSEGNEGYQFAGQLREYRSFEFTTDPMFGSPTTATGVLEVREESGFVFLILDQDAPKPDTIFSELRDATGGDPPVKMDFSPTYDAICDFVRRADTIVKIDTLRGIENPKEQIQMGENIPVETARLRFQYDDINRAVTYSDAQLNIPLALGEEDLLTSVSQEDSFREYVVQIFESVFYDS